MDPTDPFWSDSFGNVGLPNVVSLNAVAISGPNMYVGGTFSKLSADAALPVSNVAMWNGHGWHALGSGTNGPVGAIAVSGSDVYLGGSFTSAGGVAATAIARWNGSAWSAVGGGMTNTVSYGAPAVNALAVSGTKLYAGGKFDNAGAAVAHSIALWDGTTWSALSSGVQSCAYFDQPTHCFQAPTPGTVDALLVSGATLYVGGIFNDVASAQQWGLAAWNGTSWAGVGGLGIQLNGAANGTVTALAINGTTLYAAGRFDHVGGTLSGSTVSGATAVASVASFNAGIWSALGSGANYCCGSATVTSLAYANGRLLMGGNFDGAGGDGVANIGQWNGTAWSAVGPGLAGGSTGDPTALLASVAGVVAVGQFATAGVGAGAVTLNNIGLWNGVRWGGYGLGVSTGSGGGNIRAAAASARSLYVGGNFSTAGPTTLSNLAHFNGTTWDNVGGGVTGGSAQPNAIAISGRYVFVGGSFTQAGSVAASNIAMWDGASWQALGGGVDGTVNALLVYNGRLWVGGAFTHADTYAASDVATWNLTTHVWAPVGGDANYDYGNVDALGGVTDSANSANNHFVVIGGDFVKVDDGAASSPTFVTVNGLLRFDTTAPITDRFAGYSDFPGTTGSSGVSCASCVPIVNAVYADSLKVYVGGSFDTAGSIASRGFAMYDLSVAAPNGWSSPGVVGGSTATVRAITKVGASLYVAGDFSSAGTALASNIAQYTPATPAWAALGSGISSPSLAAARTLAPSADGLYVGGLFGVAGTNAAQNLALFARGLKVTQTVTPPSTATGSPVTYTATITNPTGIGATAVKLSDVLPPTAHFISAAPSQGSCTNTATSVTCAVGPLANAATATVSITVAPLYPGTVTNNATVSESSTPYTSTASASATGTAQPQTSYVAIRDTGVAPATLTIPKGQNVRFAFFGPSQHSVRDASPLGLFDSGLISPVNDYAFRYTAAGTYSVVDANSAHAVAVLVPDTLSAAAVAHGSPVTVTMASTAPAGGLVLDLQVLLPASTTWIDAQTDVSTSATPYTPPVAGSYQLRSRLRNPSTAAATAYSPPITLNAT